MWAVEVVRREAGWDGDENSTESFDVERALASLTIDHVIVGPSWQF